MKNSKSQTLALIGVALLTVSAIMLYLALSQPKYVDSATTAVAQTTSAVSVSSSANTDVTYPININTATVEELVTIDGLGEARANAIIEYREYLGGYESVEQVKNIKGFGDAVYEQIEEYLTV